MHDLPLDALFETAFGYPAESFVLRFQEPPATMSDPEPDVFYYVTDRRGEYHHAPWTLEENPFRADDPTLLFTIRRRLLDEPHEFTDTLVDLWHIPRARPEGGRIARWQRRVTGTHPLHQSRPPERRTTRRVLLDHWYDVRVDWAFPACLRLEGEDTQLSPLHLGRTKLRGRDVDPGSYEERRLKFVREGDGFVTVERAADGQERRFTPQGLGERSGGRPRVVLPHTGGFVLLHKIFRLTSRARHELWLLRAARERLQRDGLLLARLVNLYTLSYGMTDPSTDDGREVRGVIDQIHRKAHELQRATEQRLDRLEEHARESGALAWLADDLWRDRSFARAWSRTWHQLDHALGPLAFLRAALWTVRDSPLEATFYERHGAALLRLPPRPQRRPTEDDDPLLINDAYRPPAPDAGLTTAVDYLSKSVKLWTEANTWFAHRHAMSLLNVEMRGVRRTAGVPITVEQIEDFIEFVTETHPDQVRRYVRRVVRESGQPYAPTHRAFRERLERLEGAHRRSNPKLGDLLDSFGRVLTMVSFAQSLQAETWDTDHLIDFGKNVLEATDAGAIILGKEGAECIGRVLGPIIAAADIAIAARDIHLAYVEGRDTDAMISGAKAIGAALIGAAAFMNAFPGAGPVCVGMGTLISFGAELYGIYREYTRDDWEREALGIHALVFPADEADEFNVDGDAPGALHTEPRRRRRSAELVSRYGRYLGTLQAHVLEKARLREHRYQVPGWFGDRESTLAVILREGEIFANFPEPRWRYIDREQREFREEYVEHCRAVDPRWRERGSRPSPPPPLPHGAPRAS